MTLQDCTQKANDKSEFDREFTNAALIEACEDVPSFFRSSVGVRETHGIKAEIRMRAIRPNEFESRFKQAPSVLGYKMRDILIPGGGHIKAICLLDDGLWGDKGIAITYYTSREVNAQEYYQELGDHIREASSREHIERLTAASKAEHPDAMPLFRTLRWRCSLCKFSRAAGRAVLSGRVWGIRLCRRFACLGVWVAFRFMFLWKLEDMAYYCLVFIPCLISAYIDNRRITNVFRFPRCDENLECCGMRLCAVRGCPCDYHEKSAYIVAVKSFPNFI